jgi:dihydroxy-acid dehydratase
MVWDDLKPRDILRPGAFANAVKAVLSIGGSLNAVKHLQAVATEAENGVDVYGLFERSGPETPVLAGVRPIGEHLIEEFEAAGACRALMKQLQPLLDNGVRTVTGGSVADNLTGVRWPTTKSSGPSAARWRRVRPSSCCAARSPRKAR